MSDLPQVSAGYLLIWPTDEPIPAGWVKDDRWSAPGEVLIRKE